MGDTFQFVRMGYFRKDEDSSEEKPVFNRVVGLKDYGQRLRNNKYLLSKYKTGREHTAPAGFRFGRFDNN